MAENIKAVLEEVGLSEKEVEIYLALLKLGEASASRVSEIADLNRVTSYVLLKSLSEKGFCSIYTKNNIQHFKPIKPDQIIGILEEKKSKIKTIIPFLKEQEGAVSDKPEVSLFEGKKGVTAMLELMLKEAEKNKLVLAYGNLTIAEKIIEYQSLYWRKTRLSKGIQMQAVVDSLKGFEPKKEKFTQFKPDLANPSALSTDNTGATGMREDKNHNIWIGHSLTGGIDIIPAEALRKDSI